MYEKLRKLTWMDALLLMGFISLAVGISLEMEKGKGGKVEVYKKEISPTAMEEKLIVVAVAGAVEKPGVYQMKNDSRVFEVLERAGGVSGEVDKEWLEKNINLSARLRDGEKIYIQKIGERGEGGEVAGEQILRVSLNQATLSELETLPGIGPAMAGKIIAYREANGGFKNIEEVKLVSGVGEKLFEAIRDLISL